MELSNDSLGYSTPPAINPSSTSTPGSMFYPKHNSEHVRLLNYATPPAINPQSSTSTPGLMFYPKHNSVLARLVNCDLAINNLTTSSPPEDIWSNLNN